MDPEEKNKNGNKQKDGKVAIKKIEPIEPLSINTPPQFTSGEPGLTAVNLELVSPSLAMGHQPLPDGQWMGMVENDMSEFRALMEMVKQKTLPTTEQLTFRTIGELEGDEVSGQEQDQLKKELMVDFTQVSDEKLNSIEQEYFKAIAGFQGVENGEGELPIIASVLLPDSDEVVFLAEDVEVPYGEVEGGDYSDEGSDSVIIHRADLPGFDLEEENEKQRLAAEESALQKQQEEEATQQRLEAAANEKREKEALEAQRQKEAEERAAKKKKEAEEREKARVKETMARNMEQKKAAIKRQEEEEARKKKIAESIASANKEAEDETQMAQDLSLKIRQKAEENIKKAQEELNSLSPEMRAAMEQSIAQRKAEIDQQIALKLKESEEHARKVEADVLAKLNVPPTENGTTTTDSPGGEEGGFLATVKGGISKLKGLLFKSPQEDVLAGPKTSRDEIIAQELAKVQQETARQIAAAQALMQQQMKAIEERRYKLPTPTEDPLDLSKDKLTEAEQIKKVQDKHKKDYENQWAYTLGYRRGINDIRNGIEIKLENLDMENPDESHPEYQRGYMDGTGLAKEAGFPVTTTEEQGATPIGTVTEVVVENTDEAPVQDEAEKDGAKSRKTKKQEQDNAFAQLVIGLTEEEKAEDKVLKENKDQGFTKGLLVGRSVGYGARITYDGPTKKKLKITTFAATEEESEADAKDQYIQENDAMALNMQKYGNSDGSGEGESEAQTDVKPGYYDGYIQGYNSGYVEGQNLKRSGRDAARKTKEQKDMDTDEYRAGKVLGLNAGMLKAKKKTNLEAKFWAGGKEGKFINVKMHVDEVDKIATENKTTPGGELGGPAFEKGYIQNFNLGYQQALQTSDIPPVDKDFQASYNDGHKIGMQEGKGETPDPVLQKRLDEHVAEDITKLSKENKQKNRGFLAGYNTGYRQAKEAQKNKNRQEKDKINGNPNFIAGFAAGHLKGFLIVMMDTNKVSILQGLLNRDAMAEAGVPAYYPIPDVINRNLRASMGDMGAYGGLEEAEGKSMRDLIASPEFKAGVDKGFNQGYMNTLKSKHEFRAQQHKLHPDYQRAQKPVQDDGKLASIGDKDKQTYSIGKLLAEAIFRKDELNKKKTLTATEEAERSKILTSIDQLYAVVDKESEFYQKGVNDDIRGHYGTLQTAKSGDDQARQNYGGETDAQKKMYKEGYEVGKQVVKSKQVLKKLHAQGRDITARRKQLNAAILTMEKRAQKKTESSPEYKNCFRFYRNGYNFALREGVKSKEKDAGNLHAQQSDGFETVRDSTRKDGTSTSDRNLDPNALKDIKGTTNRELQDLLRAAKLNAEEKAPEDAYMDAISDVAEKHKGDIQEAFNDGADMGYNTAYAAKQVDPETGGMKGKPVDELFLEQIRKQLNSYSLGGGNTEQEESSGGTPPKKAVNEGEAKYKIGLIYFFMMGYQRWKTSYDGYGAPKGYSDARSFNIGLEDGKIKALGRKDKMKKDEAKSKDAYKTGFEQGKAQIRYADFKNMMIDAAVRQEEENQGTTKNTTEETTTDSKPKETTKSEKKKPEEDLLLGLRDMEKVLFKDEHFVKGVQDADGRWNRVVKMAKKMRLGDEETKIDYLFEFMDSSNGKYSMMLSKEGGQKIADDLYANKEKYIEDATRAYVSKYLESHEEEIKQSVYNAVKENEANPGSEATSSAGGFWMGIINSVGDFIENYSLEMMVATKMQQMQDSLTKSYSNGYKNKIQEIEQEHDDKFYGKWVYDVGFSNGVMDTNGRGGGEGEGFVDMTASSILFSSNFGVSASVGGRLETDHPKYLAGYQDGLVEGTKMKHGLTRLNNEEVAKVKGGQSNAGFQAGKEAGAKQGKINGNDVNIEEPNLEVIKKEAGEALNVKEKDEAKRKEILDGYTDYVDSFVTAYLEAYRETRDFNIGKKLGYQVVMRDGEGDDPYDVERYYKEESNGTNEMAFFNGFVKGRETAMLGLPESSGGEKDKKEEEPAITDVGGAIFAMAKGAAWQNAAASIVIDMNLAEKAEVLTGKVKDTSPGQKYGKCSNLAIVKALSVKKSDGFSLGGTEFNRMPDDKDRAGAWGMLEDALDMNNISYKEEEKESYLKRFAIEYKKIYSAVYYQGFLELSNALIATGFGVEKDKRRSTTLSKESKSTYNELAKLLFGVEDERFGGQDFQMIALNIFNTFYALESTVEKVGEGLSEEIIEINNAKEEIRIHSKSKKKPEGKLKSLEKFLEDHPKAKAPEKRKNIEKYKKIVADHDAQIKKAKERLAELESEADKKIEKLNSFLKEELKFEASEDSNKNILSFLADNLAHLNQAKNMEFDSWEFDPGILSMPGSFAYKHSKADMWVEIAGDGNLEITNVGKDVDIYDVGMKIKMNGFEFSSSGIEYQKLDGSVSLLDVTAVIPKIEGGENEGQESRDFSELEFSVGKGVKKQLYRHWSLLSEGKKKTEDK